MSESDARKPSSDDFPGLVREAIGGHEKAFRELLDRNRQRVMGICCKMLSDVIEAEEAAQETFVKVYFHLREFDLSKEFAVWVSTIAVNECRDRLRKRSRRGKLYRELSETDGASMPLENNERRDARERLDAVESALQLLPDKLREVIILKAYGEHSYDDIARILGVRVGTVMSRLFRARRRLTEKLEKGGQD